MGKSACEQRVQAQCSDRLAVVISMAVCKLMLDEHLDLQVPPPHPISGTVSELPGHLTHVGFLSCLVE